MAKTENSVYKEKKKKKEEEETNKTVYVARPRESAKDEFPSASQR